MNEYKFHITGTHCPSCKIFIEETLGEQDFLSQVSLDLKKETLSVKTDSDKTKEELADLITEKIKINGYKAFVEKTEEIKENNNTIWTAIPIGIAVLILFFLLQKSGILNIGLGKVTPTTSFIVGLIASVSSCLAIVGGLVLSLSAKISQDDKSDTKTFLLFHIGRLLSFAILGGLLGAIGEVIGINFTITSILGLLASVIMLILGLNLVGLFSKSITVSPKIFNFFKKIEYETITPLIVGFATFFLPCGFTQSMQVQALSSGSFISGLSIMLAFALGTLPVLLLLSFGSASFAHSKYSALFFKSVGVVVIGLGLFATLSALAGLGFINPLFNI